MAKNILVNTIEIDKATIRDLIKQGEENDALYLIAKQANVTLKAARDIVRMFKEEHIDRFDGKDLFLLDYDEIANNNDSQRANPEGPSFLEVEVNSSRRTGAWKGLFILFFIALLAFVMLKYVVGFNQIGHHISELAQLFDKNDSSPALDADTSKQNHPLKAPRDDSSHRLK